MKTFIFKLDKDIAFKCTASDADSAWQTFSTRKQLSIEYLKTHYKIETI